MDCKLIGSFFEIISMVADEQKTPKNYGGQHLLYHSELNFINAIYSNPEANARELAELLNVTQGAITQVADKLVKKKLIEKYSIKGNSKERYYRLTSEGERVRLSHIAYHEEANTKLCDYFCSLGSEESKILLNFFEKFKECMPASAFSCRNEMGCKNNTAERRNLNEQETT